MICQAKQFQGATHVTIKAVTKWTLRVLGLALVAFVAYIWVPEFHRYRYISLEGATGVTMLTRDHVSPTMLGFVFERIPVSYQLVRPAYTVRFEIDRFGQGRAINMTLTPPGTTFHFQEETGPTTTPCGEGELWHRTPPLWLYTVWECDAGWNVGARAMRFDVLDADGNLLGHEEIPYEIVTKVILFRSKHALRPVSHPTRRFPGQMGSANSNSVAPTLLERAGGWFGVDFGTTVSGSKCVPTTCFPSPKEPSLPRSPWTGTGPARWGERAAPRDADLLGVQHLDAPRRTTLDHA